MSQPAISKHLKVLERAGLISRGRDAQRRPCRIEAQPLAEATGWLERYRAIWEGNFQRLDALLEELQPEKRTTANNDEIIGERRVTDSSASHEVRRPRNRDHARLRCAPRARLRRLHQARSGQALAARTARLVDAGLRDRPEGRRALPLCLAERGQGSRHGRGRRLSRDRSARAARPSPSCSTRTGPAARRW